MTSDRTTTDLPGRIGFDTEHLVGFGFRHWYAGLTTSDLDAWETAWSTYQVALGAPDARRAVSELSNWVREVHAAASRPIVVAPRHCPRFCRDECTAIALVAACQRDVCPAARACAFALVGVDAVDPVIDAACQFADVLDACGHRFTDPIRLQVALADDHGRPPLKETRYVRAL
jgi:hypothetical protein